MNAEILFSILNTAILPAWFLLIVLPRWHWTKFLVTSGAYSGLFAIAYTILIFLFFTQAQGDFTTLSGVRALFAQPYLLVAGWVHYLAFDLLVGSWILKDAQERKIKHTWIIPSLVMTLMFGPLGWGSYRVLRLVNTRLR